MAGVHSPIPVTASPALDGAPDPTPRPLAAAPRPRRTKPRGIGVNPAAWSLVGTRDLVELCRMVYAAAARQLDATIFFVGLYDGTSQTVEVVWQVENGAELAGGSFPIGRGFTSNVIRTGQARLIRRWSREGPRVQVQYATRTPGLPESAAAAPLRLGDQVIGVICAQSYHRGAYTERDLKLLRSLADEAAIVIAGLHYSERLGEQLGRRVSELEAILANMADALLIVDAQGKLVRLNRVARTLLCLDDRSVVLGQPLEEAQAGLWPASGRAVADAVRPIIAALRETKAPQEVEVEIAGPGRRTLSFRASPLYDADASFAGGVVVFRDVTGRREIERFKDEMLSIASHDLKTPATVIKAQAQWLRRRVRSSGPVDADVDEGLSMIADQADRLSKLLNLLLDLSRIEAGRLDLDFAPTDLRSILVNIARAIQSTSDQHQIVVDAPAGVIGHWDARRLEEVIQNLLSNAIKYSPGGGQIDLRLLADEHSATVLVRDRGIGMPPDEVPHLFERFYRGQDLRRLEGTGLGLYICQAIVAAHGGRIWAESDGPGQGSTLGLTLPLHPPQSPASN